MVKLGSNLCEKPDKEQGTGSGDDFDNIPLITPLDVNQLQQPFPDKVIVKTRTEYQLQQKKKRKLHVPGIKKLNINLYDEVSEKVKGMCPWNECKTQLGLNRGVLTSISLMYWGILSIGLVPEAHFPPRIPWDMENSLWHYKNQDLTGLILITMAFLTCLLMLVMYKALWYDQLTCPEGFVFKHKHCIPAALEMYYSEQEVGPHGSLYTAINHVNQGKKTIPELPSPWLPVINALKEAEKGKEDPAGVQ